MAPGDASDATRAAPEAGDGDMSEEADDSRIEATLDEKAEGAVDRSDLPDVVEASQESGDAGNGCLPAMARIAGFCVDRYEAFVVEVREDGAEVAHSPFVPVDGLSVRAKTEAGVSPQGYISQVQAIKACENPGKRLCAAAAFARACRGDDTNTRYPYGGTTRVAGACNEGKGTPMVRLFGSDSSTWTYDHLNDARLNQLSDTLAPTASFPQCASPSGVYDCVGNLNEWGADVPDPRGHATSRGGSFVDSELNGSGCLYLTTAHEPTYHDFSTGFRCCMDAF